ncbi:hypothetical protein ACFE04_025083 [Oxalis oulophora]
MCKKELFKSNKVLRVRPLKDHKNNLKGVGYCRFVSRKAAKKAVKQKQGHKLYGVPIRLALLVDKIMPTSPHVVFNVSPHVARKKTRNQPKINTHNINIARSTIARGTKILFIAALSPTCKED